MSSLAPPPLDGLLRWTNVLLRGLHLVAVILLGAALLGAGLDPGHTAGGVAATGFAMFALDIWRKPGHLRETAGCAVLLKLGLVAWMALDAGARPFLFWLIVAGSAISAHAPARFRHAVLFGNDMH
jgi:hypothetical protein